MKAKPVILLFEDFDDPGVTQGLRRLYAQTLMPLTTTLLPRWEQDAKKTLGDAHMPVTEGLDESFVDTLHDTPGVMAASGTVACRPFFGHYDSKRDAAIFGLQVAVDIPEAATQLWTLFDPQHFDDHNYFLVFRLEELRCGTIVLSDDGAISGAPQLLSSTQHDMIFTAAGIPKPE